MIFLPVEVTKRDLIGKTLLGCYLASKDHEVTIFEHTFFDRYLWLKNSIYIGKNCFRTEVPHDPKYYNKMKKNKIRVFFLDDEGGIYPGKNLTEYNEALERRLDYKILNKDDKIFTWGDYQKNYYLSKKTKAKVVSTGYPSFVYLKKKYHNIFKNLDLKITNNQSDYVLITTRFGEANPLKKFDYYIGENSGSTNSINDKLNHLKEKSILLPYFIEAIHLLSIKYPDLKFIIRPHPEESNEIYEVFFSKHDNVLVTNYGPVESWIRSAMLVLSYGCTTLLQSEIAEKKVINYEPDIINFSKSKIPIFVDNSGLKVKNLDELLSAFHSLITSNNINPLKVSDKIKIENVMPEILNEVPLNNKKSNLFLLKIFGYIENFKNYFKYLLGYSSNFDTDSLFDLKQNIINTGEDLYKTKFRIKEISKKVFVISKV